MRLVLAYYTNVKAMTFFFMIVKILAKVFQFMKYSILCQYRLDFSVIPV